MLISWRLGLNQLAVQTINYLVYPLQLTLFVPFAIWGQKLCQDWFAVTVQLPWQNLQSDWSRLGKQPVAGARLRPGRLGHADTRIPPRRL